MTEIREQKYLGWSAKRELSKISYRIHTYAIKQNLIPPEVSAARAAMLYANKADVLCLSNMEKLNALFIKQGVGQKDRLVKRNQIAIHQMSVPESNDNNRKLLK